MAEDLILYSVANFKEVVLPALELVGAKSIVEIGSECGAFTLELFAHAERLGGKLITIDPAPDASALQFMAAWRDSRHFKFVQTTSHEAIPALPEANAYIIDGDHNYYTVGRELELIHETQGQNYWLAFMHDVAWPCGRRDWYYSPERLPTEHVHPHSRNGGVTLDQPGVVPWGFGNPAVVSVGVKEGGPKNGVLTAIEDFLAGHPELEFQVVPAFFGLGVIYARNAPWAKKLQAHLAPYVDNPLLARMEQNRIRLFLRVLADFHKCNAPAPKASFFPGRKLLEAFQVSSRAEFDTLWTARLANTIEEQDALVRAGGQSFTLPGECVVCGGEADFMTDFLYTTPDPNGWARPAWRERQVCRCGLNCRQRSSFHVLSDSLGLRPDAAVYCTEQQSALFRRIREVFPRTVSSEYLGNTVPLGTRSPEGIRNEDITRLTFADNSFDCIFSLDVMEHVPDFQSGFTEMVRCLKPGGELLLTIPFHFDQDTTVIRASLESRGRLVHHLPPIYHGDPINAKGALCFNDFGWDLLELLRRVGFGDVSMFLFSAPHYGYAGMQFVILGTCQKGVAHHSSRPRFLNSGQSGRRSGDRKPAAPAPDPILAMPQEVLRRRAAELFDQGRWGEAGQHFTTLAKRRPDDFAAWRGCCECARQQGHEVLADILAQDGLKQHPEWAARMTDPPVAGSTPTTAASPSGLCEPAEAGAPAEDWHVEGRPCGV